jgi:Glycosyl hydrolase catalytic core
MKYDCTSQTHKSPKRENITESKAASSVDSSSAILHTSPYGSEILVNCDEGCQRSFREYSQCLSTVSTVCLTRLRHETVAQKGTGQSENEQHKFPDASDITFAGRVPALEKNQPRKLSLLLHCFALIVACALFSGLVGALVHQRQQRTEEGPSTTEESSEVVLNPLTSSGGDGQVEFTAAPSPSMIYSVRIGDDVPTGAPYTAYKAETYTTPAYTAETYTPTSAYTAETNTPTSATSPIALSGSVSPSIATTPACTNQYPTPPTLPGKKGAAFTLRAEGQMGSWVENLPKVLLLNPYWNYDWGMVRIDAQPDDIEFVPMVWGASDPDQLHQRLQEHVVPYIESGQVKRLFGFNEPDLRSQANMNVRQALNLWPELEFVNISLATPSCAKPAGPWMKAFMANVTQSCKRADWVGVHWYGGTDFASFVSRITNYYELYRRPLVITEFGSADFTATTVENNQHSPAAVLAFMKQALPWLEAQYWIVGYVWFAFNITKPSGTSSALIDDQGNLTALGRFYASVRNELPEGDQSIEL